MNNLEKREKILLYILVVVLLAILPFVFVTRDLIKKDKELGQELKNLQTQKEEFLVKRAGFKKLEQNLEAMSNDMEILRAEGANISKTYDAHYAFTELTTRNNIDLQNLSIEDPVEVELEGSTENVSANVRKPIKMGVSMLLKGSLPNILNLVNDINQKGEFFVLENFVIGDIENKNDINAQLMIGLYMVLSEEERIQISGN